MPWLEPDDYPQLLACADLGVSLHTSSSGLDLPMKVVDMFGCGLPVAAINFSSLPELVRHNENGMIFETSDELAMQICQWFEGYPEKGQGRRESFIQSAKACQDVRWEQYWQDTVLPVLEKL
jgi:beta-1,4-mannosyltransferase